MIKIKISHLACNKMSSVINFLPKLGSCIKMNNYLTEMLIKTNPMKSQHSLDIDSLDTFRIEWICFFFFLHVSTVKTAGAVHPVWCECMMLVYSAGVQQNVKSCVC